MLSVACRGGDETAVLKVLPDALIFSHDAVGKEQRVTVMAAGSYDFTIEYAEPVSEWLSVHAEGNEMVVSVIAENIGGDRHASIVIVCGSQEARVAVTQYGGTSGNYAVELDPSHACVPAVGEADIITVTSDILTAGSGLQASVGEDVDWYMAYIDGSMLVVEVKPNTGAMERNGTVTVMNEQGGTAEFTFVQAASDTDYGITLEPDNIVFDAAGGEMAVAVTTAGTELVTAVGAECVDWLSAAVAEDGILTVAAERNVSSERCGTVTVSNAEGFSAQLVVVQAGAGDTSVRLEPERVSFDYNGGVSECRIITGGTGLEVSVSEEYSSWLSARQQDMALYVEATPMSLSGERHGTVRVANAEGESAVLSVVQTGITVSDLSGTWHWSSLSVSDGNWNNAVEVSGTVQVTATDNGYDVVGIAGSVVSGLGVAAPVMHMELRGGAVGIVEGEAFVLAGIEYHSAAGAVFDAGMIDVAEDAFAVVSGSQRTVNGVLCEVLEFPVDMVADSTVLPEYPQLWGTTGVWHYVYYEQTSLGGVNVTVPVEYHRNVLMWRPLQ